MDKRNLTKPEFLACCSEPMRDMTAAPEPAADIWPYVDALEPDEVGARELGDVAHVYRDGKGLYDHVLLETDTADVFLAIIVDLGAEKVMGHHLLDLRIEYGLATPH